MKRSFDGSGGDDNLGAFLRDFAFLFRHICREQGELDLRLRNNYFNIYHRGNSLAKVTRVRDGGSWEVEISSQFADGELCDPRFAEPERRGAYLLILSGFHTAASRWS